MFTLADVDDLIDTLRAADIKADVDPAKFTPPAVWVQVLGYDRDTLATVRTRTRLLMIGPDRDSRRAMTRVLDLANKVAAVLPITDVTAQTVLMPDGTRLPALAAPFILRSIPTTP